MARFDSFSYAPYETRRVLRDRLGRMLRPAQEGPSHSRGSASAVSDVEILELLCRVRISHADDVDKVRETYAEHRNTHPGVPSFDDLIDDGWFGVAWGRVTTELDTRMSARQQDEPLRAGLQIVLNAPHHDPTLTFVDLSDLSPAAQALAASLAERPENVRSIPAPSPEWIAARLWERRPEVVEVDALRWWVDRWRLLGQPLGAPTTWWTEGDASAWRRAAIDVLRDDPGLVAWQREKGLIDARLSHEQHRIPSPPIPATLVERYVWLQGTHLDQWGRAFESCGDTWVLLAMLYEDLAAHDRALEGPSSAELLDLVVERPTPLVLLATRIRQEPALLADLLLHPPTSALACLIAADWRAQPIGAWERFLQDSENAAARERSFTDAVTIAVHHLRAGAGSVKEFAELLVWIHRRMMADVHALPRRPHAITERMLDVVRSELQTLSRSQLERMLAALSFREADGLGTPRFAAAIDIATVASLTDAVDAESMVAAYVAALRPEGVPDSVALTPAQAASVVLVARRASSWSTFLAPFDMRERLAGSKHAANEYIARDAIARALRAHIRVLSRAIVAWDGVPPDDLVNALASAIRAGSSEHSEKGRVAAFAARHESIVSRPEPPLADDVAAACRRLPDTSRSSIDEALMLLDEPLALAHLLQSAPLVLRAKLRARIDALTPDDAASVHSLTEMQQRIEELLNAGATSAAAKYIDIERDLRTLGRVEGREVVRLRWQLRLALLQSDFTRIALTTVPDGLERSEVASAQDAIDFYKGVAELSAPSGSASTAESLFGSLAQRHPENGAYVVNLFAARLSRLLAGDTFNRLSGADIPTAREALEAADRALQSVLGVGDADRATHESNRAILLLAIGRPDDAYEAIHRIQALGEHDAASAWGAVALARMGRVEEAHATLAAGEAIHPNSVLLKAAREHVDLGRPGRFRVLGVANDDNIAAIQSALFQLTNMAPGVQARVVGRETIEAHLTDEVRSAAAGVTAIVPMMRGVQLEEDDISAVLLRILDARVRIFGWSVPDQSKGGYSARGNPGERDLALRKDGYVITVIEAVVCNSNPATETTKRNLTSHFQKLFGYDQCRVFFHVVYSYVDAPHDVVATMRVIATSSAPPAFAFSHAEDLPHEDSRPVGFVATYSTQGGGEVKVVCLVMDMRQQAQRDAAALAGQTQISKSRTRSSSAT